MSPYHIDRLTIKSLWGYKDYDIAFNNDVNVIIGPNASGKTTLINVLYDVLTANLMRLSQLEFSEVIIHLKPFEREGAETVTVLQTADELQLSIGKKNFKYPIGPLQEGRHLYDGPSEVRRRFRFDIHELQEQLRGLVPAVWLPVSRRLPIAEEEEMARRPLHRKPLESVDECLAALIDSLVRYRFVLNTGLAELRKEFQQHALENILYDKRHDRSLKDPKQLVPPSEEDKQQLLQAFRDVGYLDGRMEARIEEHFAASKDAIAKLKANPRVWQLETLMIMPLIYRTKAIVEYAQELQAKCGKLFAPLHAYEDIVNSFLSEKRIHVSEDGELIIVQERDQRVDLEWRHLSSGEKQILILLTQALLSERSPTVYVADEPELSLHVLWQEKLLGALTKLAGRCQFIVATHSPDIVSGFGSKVIDLAKL